jgi:pyrroline-5-carboxylate reductase
MQTAFIGGGHMASAIIGGLRNTGTPGGTIVVADPVAAQLERLSRDFEVRTTGDNAAAAVSADVIVLAGAPGPKALIIKSTPSPFVRDFIHSLVEPVSSACVSIRFGANAFTRSSNA